DELFDEEDAFCKTFIAALPRSGDPMMLKVLRSKDAVAQKRFLRGARYASLIHHPCVVPIVDWGTDGADGHAWVLTGWSEGVGVDKLILRSPGGMLPVKLAVQISIAVLRGLDAAHQTGIVHRNIKPGNIMVDEAGHVMITNFDKARVIDPKMETEALTAMGSSLGTPHYMPPEQLKTSKVDYRADLYAFGATMFHMLTGRPPFEGRNIMDVIEAKMKTDPPPVSSYNKACRGQLDHIVQTLMAREPDARYPTATHCAVALKALNL
ncbi:MAG: serine/threonine protein kinase, partial [Planctomycetota bacterium]